MELATLTPLLTSLGISPAISARPTVALLALSLGVNFSYIGNPAWLAGWGITALLAGLVAAEWFGGRNIEIAEMLEEFMPYVKTVLAILVSYALLDGEAATFIGTLAGDSSSAAIAAEPWWETAFQAIWSFIVGVVTWFVTIYRKTFYFFFNQFDEDDDLGLLSLYTLVEYMLTAGGVFLAILVPILAIFFFIAVGIGLYLLRKYLEGQEIKKMIPCKNRCGTQIYGSALACPTCYQPNAHVMRVGLLGQTTNKPAMDREAQHWGLIAQKRCPRCATPFIKEKGLRKQCTACQQMALASPDEVRAYIAHYSKKLIPALIVSFVGGLIPILGVVIAVAYSRLTLVSPIRRHVSLSRGCLGRTGLRIINLILIILQPIPILGWITLPLMTFLNFTVYRQLLISEAGR